MITSDTNFRGNFDSIEAVWEAIPYGGVEGDYLNIQGVKYRWNKYLAMWENAEVVTETPARETVTFDEDVNMQNNLTVAGVLRAKEIVAEQFRAWNPKGNYDATKVYSINDLVYDTNTKAAYLSMRSNNIGHPVDENDESYEEGWWMEVQTIGVPKGDFSLGNTYNVGDIVFDSDTNSSYLSLKADNMGHPVTDETWWMKVVDGSYVNLLEEELQQLVDSISEGTQQQVEELNEALEALEAQADQSRQDIQDIVDSLAVVQTTGQSASDVMSQKAVTDSIDKLNEGNKVWENEIYSSVARYIHTDGSLPVTTQPAWRITDPIDLNELRGCDIHFFRIYKSALDMLIYALYAEQTQASFINGDYVSDAITQQADNLTWDSINVDDILRQYPTARYIRFTLHTSYLINQPYANTGAKKVLDVVKSNTTGQDMNSVLGMGWTSYKRIDADGNVSECASTFTVSGLIQLTRLTGCLLVGYECYSPSYDTRTWALYNSSNVKVAVSEPADSHSYSRLIIIDPQELLAKYPSATQIRFGCHINYLLELVEKGSVIAKTYWNEINAERPSKGSLDNFSFAAAGSSGIINIVSNTDADVTQYETLGVNFAQVLKIGGYYACFYYASAASGEYNQAIFCAYSSNGTTWTRGFPPNVTPPVAGTNKLFDNTASGYKAITESCWCRVSDNDYPYRMIANRNMSGTNKSCWMWKSADGYHYELMGQILGDTYRPDTQYAAVVRGNVIKLYLRISETVGSQYKRSIAVAYLDLDGNILTPPYKLIYDYRYTIAACVLDNTRELLMPTWFANNINSAPKTENAYLETFIVEGDKYEKIDTNINDCLNNDTLWVAVAPDFVTINNEQYICVNERNTDHASAMDKSSIKLVKVTRT